MNDKLRQFNVTGMSCAACQARIEKAVLKLDGVDKCSVNLLTNTMGVEGKASNSEIIGAVEAAGYGAEVKKDSAGLPGDNETGKIAKRLVLSIIFLVPLMYVSMGHEALDLPLPGIISHGIYNGLIQAVLAFIIILVNRKFYISGFKGLIHLAPNMDTLVSMGSGVSFLWSIYQLIASDSLSGLYFDSSAMILTLITVGKLLEAKSKGKTTSALKDLMKLAPKTAVIIENGKEKTVPVENIAVNDIFAVKSGESIPVDGVIIEGSAAVDESAITGESLPVDKSEGDYVTSATVNQSGYIRCRATDVGEDTTLSKIIRMVSDAAATKAPIAKIADKVSGVFVPAVMGIALITLAVWLLLGRGAEFALTKAVSVLVISCPCALGLATPVAIMVGSGVGAKQGILFKTAEALEQTGKTDIAVLDKTGTVTAGNPGVTDIITGEKVTENELLIIAYSLESKSNHPLARSITAECERRNITACNFDDFRELPGSGLAASISGKTVFAGSYSFVSSKINVDEDIKNILSELQSGGKTLVLFAGEDKYLGAIALADEIKPDSRQAVNELKNMGISVVMLTGDNEKTAERVASDCGIDFVISGVKPDGKEKAVTKLKKLGKVAMVGDGINDAVALTAADTGIAIGVGTDVALDSADAVLVNSKLCDVPAAVRLSRAAMKNIKENLFWAFFYNALCIPLAAGCCSSLLGFSMNPMVGAAAMSLSSLFVVSNALRLNLFDVHAVGKNTSKKNKTDKMKIQSVIDEINSEKRLKNMTKTMIIEGMMCPHCEARVKKTLEALDGVTTALVSHEKGTAQVSLSADIADDVLKTAVEEQGYCVKEIK